MRQSVQSVDFLPTMGTSHPMAPAGRWSPAAVDRPWRQDALGVGSVSNPFRAGEIHGPATDNGAGEDESGEVMHVATGSAAPDAGAEPKLAADPHCHCGRAVIMLYGGTVRVVDPQDYQTYDWEDWSRLRPGGGRAVCALGGHASARTGGGRVGSL